MKINILIFHILFENNNNFIKDLNINEDKQKYENTIIDTYNKDKIIDSNNSNQEYMNLNLFYYLYLFY